MSEQMSKEVWATYSVRDHLKPGALAADIMLFDRLVFPVPETPKLQGPEHEPGEVEWKRDEEEWDRWEKERWDPAGQSELLRLLKPVIRKQEWATLHDDQYRSEAATLAAQQVQDYAFQATRNRLTRDLPNYVTGVAAIGPVYHDVEEIKRDLRIKSLDNTKQLLPGNVLAAALSWEFLVPDLTKAQTTESLYSLLKGVVDFVTNDPDFRTYRTAFWNWQQKFLGKEGETDPESIKQCLKVMRELLEGAKKAAQKSKMGTVSRWVTRIAPGAVPLLAAATGLISPGEAGGVGLVFTTTGLVLEQTLFPTTAQGIPGPAAFVIDVQRHFGRK